jgi:hypothetical protein
MRSNANVTFNLDESGGECGGDRLLLEAVVCSVFVVLVPLVVSPV